MTDTDTGHEIARSLAAINRRLSVIENHLTEIRRRTPRPATDPPPEGVQHTPHGMFLPGTGTLGTGQLSQAAVDALNELDAKEPTQQP